MTIPLEVLPDHVHLLVGCDLQFGIHRLVKLLKGFSSHALREEFPALKRQMVLLASEYSPTVILVEDKASGQSLIQELKYETALPIRPVAVDRDKVARTQAVTPLIEARKVFLPESAPWLADFIDELAAFPMGVHDDAVDSATQALNYLRYRRGNSVAIYHAFTGECLASYV